MGRSFRVYEKKRGNRRTGSGKVGSVWETLFFAIFFLLGCGGLLVILFVLVIPEWRVNHEFVQTTCVARGKELGQTTSDEGGTLYRPEIQIEYQINGKTHVTTTYNIRGGYSNGREAEQAVLDRFQIGKQYPCWYDPHDPGVAVLVRGYSWWIWLIAIVPGSFILIGGGGFIYRALHWGKSAEHRAATQRELFDRNVRSSGELPNVPPAADMTNSPGTTLKFRLPISTSPTWALVWTLVACLLWNGIISLFVFEAVDGHLAGDPDWVLTLFMIPFVLVGIFLIVWFFRQLLLTTGVGPTLVEISDHPLYPGETYRLFVSQSGRLRMNSLEVLLVCEEQARYRQGTNMRTETRPVYQQRVHSRQGFEIHRGAPMEVQCDLQIPAAMMHSFKADHNQVSWKLVVKGDVAGWPDSERSFPVIVYPHNHQGSRG